MNQRFAFDLELAGRGRVAGADEAGRGCLAGPLVAAAVCFDFAALDDADYAALAGLDDSKRLTRARREALYGEILRRARQVVVVSCCAATIDRDGLHRCNLALLARAVEALRPRPAVDARRRLRAARLRLRAPARSSAATGSRPPSPPPR